MWLKSLGIVATVIIIGFIIYLTMPDATKSKIEAYGQDHHVVCYNFHQKISDNNSTGRVSYSSQGADNKVSFEDKATGKLVEIIMGNAGSCVVTVV